MRGSKNLPLLPAKKVEETFRFAQGVGACVGVPNDIRAICLSEHHSSFVLCLAPFRDGTETPTKGQVLTHWKSTKKWALVDPLTGDAAPCRLVARGVGRFAACKGSAAEAVAPITMRHRLPFAHYAAPYAAVLACKASDECSEFCDQAGLCAA